MKGDVLFFAVVFCNVFFVLGVENSTDTERNAVVKKGDEKTTPAKGKDPTTTRKPMPPPSNTWATYYKIEGTQFNSMQDLFTISFRKYIEDPQRVTKCAKDRASFSRWYNNTDKAKENELILSYFCMTKGQMGYEHLIVDKNEEVVLDFNTALKGFGIPDAGPYSDSEVLYGDKAEEIQVRELDGVKKDISALHDDSESKICPDPGTQTLFKVQVKVENELNYFRFPISCNITAGLPWASHMAHIEVVEDKLRGVLNQGKPVLASIDQPVRNTEFIAQKNKEIEDEKKRKEEEEKKKKEEEARKAEVGSGKTSGAGNLGCTLATLVIMPVIKYLFRD